MLRLVAIVLKLLVCILFYYRCLSVFYYRWSVIKLLVCILFYYRCLSVFYYRLSVIKPFFVQSKTQHSCVFLLRFNNGNGTSDFFYVFLCSGNSLPPKRALHLLRSCTAFVPRYTTTTVT